MDQLVKQPRPVAPASMEEALGLSSKSRRRRWPWLLAAALLAGGAGFYAWYGSADAPVAYAAQPAARGALTVEVAATGNLQPLTQVEVSSELSGVMRTVNVRENQRVATGEVLAEMDTTRIRAQLERAEANVRVAEARISETRVTVRETGQAFERAEQLSGRGMVADQALETARATRDRAQSTLESADAQLAVARAELSLQQADFDRSTITAPIDGIVLTRSVNPGQTVAASTSAPILFVIAENLETMELRAAIDEADIGAIDIGQTARFTVDAFPDRRFDAEISDISFASVETEGVVTYEARLAVDNEELLLRPGMTATVNIVTRQSDDALLVPSSAFRFSPPAQTQSRSFSLSDLFNPPRRGPPMGFGGRGAGAGSAGRTLYVMENGAPVQRNVQIGATAGDMTEIVSGLDEGDQVVTGIRRGSGR